ncbi:MAG: helix-turn-helix domain-containing protein [Hyphomicrobiales bacterium]
MSDIPNYILYGEEEKEIFPDFLHIEPIHSRSIHHGWNFRSHQHHNLHQFFYILGGKGRIFIDKIEYELATDQVISLPPSTIHGFKFSPDIEGWVVTLPQIHLQKIIENTAFFIKPISQILIHNCINNTIKDEFRYIFRTLNDTFNNTHPTRDFRLKCYANLLIDKVTEISPYSKDINRKVPKQKQVLVQEFQNKINENYKQKLTVKQYAAMMRISPTHLNRVCKSVLNLSASDLANERSILESKRLLSYTAMNISEIAYELGFCDAAHFSTFFSNKTSQKPSDFRKSSLTQ